MFLALWKILLPKRIDLCAVDSEKDINIKGTIDLVRPSIEDYYDWTTKEQLNSSGPRKR